MTLGRCPLSIFCSRGTPLNPESIMCVESSPDLFEGSRPAIPGYYPSNFVSQNAFMDNSEKAIDDF